MNMNINDDFMQTLALTDRESDSATAPRNPDQTRIVASFQSKPYPKYLRKGNNAPTTMHRDT